MKTLSRTRCSISWRWYREHKLDNTYVYDGVKEALDGDPEKP